MNTRPYVVYPAEGPYRRDRSYATGEAARRAAKRLANETGWPYRVEYRPRSSAGEGYSYTVPPLRERDTEARRRGHGAQNRDGVLIGDPWGERLAEGVVL